MIFPIRVYYEDTDAGGVVYHSNYLKFFERARTECLRQAGFSQQQLLAEQLAFVVTRVEIDYKYPAKLDDLLNVETEIVELKRASIVFKQRLLRAGELLSCGIITVAAVNLSKMKAMAIPETIRERLQAV